MKKSQAFALLGATTLDSAARLMGCTRQAVAKWPDELPQALADRVIAACVRRDWRVYLDTDDGATTKADRLRCVPTLVREALGIGVDL